MNETIGSRFRKARIAAGLKQRDIADKLSIHVNTIHNLECNKSNVGMFTFIEIARMCGASLDYLVYGNDSNSVCQTLAAAHAHRS